MSIFRHLPNVLTLGNLFLGMAGILSITNGIVLPAIYCMIGSLILDVLDGAIARKMGVAGPLGVQLDSLADIVSFGVLPAIMLFFMGARFGGGFPSQPAVAILAGLLVVSAGLRLGRFNIDTRARDVFWGLATPAGAIVIASWLWAQVNNQDLGISVTQHPFLIIAIPVALMILYQVPLRLPGLKSKGIALYLLIFLMISMLAGFFLIGPISIFLGLAAYIFIGLVNLMFRFY